MERRNVGLGYAVGCLGLVLMCCLLPYLVSSIYSIVGAVLQVPTAPTWLWGEWVNGLSGQSDLLYMLLTEGPLCCVGVVSLLLVVLGLVLALGSGRRAIEPYDEYEVPPEEPYLT